VACNSTPAFIPYYIVVNLQRTIAMNDCLVIAETIVIDKGIVGNHTCIRVFEKYI
jgi:hypothetical protein